MDMYNAEKKTAKKTREARITAAILPAPDAAADFFCADLISIADNAPLMSALSIGKEM